MICRKCKKTMKVVEFEEYCLQVTYIWRCQCGYKTRTHETL